MLPLYIAGGVLLLKFAASALHNKAKTSAHKDTINKIADNIDKLSTDLKSAQGMVK